MFPPDIHLVRGYIQVLSQFHKITAQRGLINRKKQIPNRIWHVCNCWAIACYNMTSPSCIISKNLGHLQTGANGCCLSTTRFNDLQARHAERAAKARRDDRGRTPQLNRKKVTTTVELRKSLRIKWSPREREAERKKERNASCKHWLRIIYSQG